MRRHESIAMLAVVAGAALGCQSSWDDGGLRESRFAGPPARSAHQTRNGLPPRGSSPDADTAMLLKYTARCALAEGQFLELDAGLNGSGDLHFPGAIGLAPEWRDGICDAGCQERVSACLIALTNRTGMHVELSLLAAGESFGDRLRPGPEDLDYPHQEGAFFGNVFSGQAFTCRGHAAGKALQVKRFCAVAPETCSGVAEYRDAGLCQDVCQQECRQLSDGSQRCAATTCRDPEGHDWRYPITTYLRNRIEAGNADVVIGAARRDDELDSLDRGDSARFALVDFGHRGRSVSELALRIAGRGRGGRIEAWLDGKRRLGVLDVRDTAGIVEEQVAPLAVERITGRHALVLKVVSGRDIGRLSSVEVRRSGRSIRAITSIRARAARSRPL
jgi:hypothetical protein